jgi:probable HAF family extracellular repeat protein
MTDIGAWAGDHRDSSASAINDAGVVVGAIEPEFANGFLAFRYEGGQMDTIPGLPNAYASLPWAINNHNQIVGMTDFANLTEVATLFQDGVAYDLNTLIEPGSGWQLFAASDMNDQGQIVGVGTYQGSAHAFLLTPRGVITRYCTSTINSSGVACTIDGDGLPSVSRNQFDLVAGGGVPNKPGLFFYNASQRQLPFGNGFLCVGGGAPAIYRLGPATVSDGSGVAVRHLDFASAPAGSGPGAIHALATWNFQYYFRDPAAGGARFNLSDAISVTFCP